jgi:hypothetical protein
MKKNWKFYSNVVFLIVISVWALMLEKHEHQDAVIILVSLPVAILLIAALRYWLLDSLRMKSFGRGFEVKLTTGEPPVPQKNK